MATAADSLGGLTDTISSKINTISEGTILWGDSATIKAAVDRLKESSSLAEALDEVKEQLDVNPQSHNDFLSAGGAEVLCNLLSSGSSAVQLKCLSALEALALNAETISHLKETRLVDILVDIIHSSRAKVISRRRQKGGTIIKLLAGWQPGHAFYTGRGNEYNASASSLGVFRIDHRRDKPLPLWYHTTSSVLPWDAEAVSCLVELLSADLCSEVHETAERAIKKILRVRELTRHIILDRRDVSDLVGVISSMHSSAAVAMKIVTFMSIMHPSNEVTFVRTGGLEGLVKAMRSDNIGSISGEMAAWVVAYFASKNPDNGEKIVEAGGAEALVELLHSPDHCAREASARACVSMLTCSNCRGNAVRKRFGEANGIPALLSALQDGQYQSREQAVVLDLLRALMEMAKHKDYRKEILKAGGLQTLKESVSDSGFVVQEASRKLKKLLVSRSTRFKLALGTTRPHGSFAQRFTRRMRRMFCHKTAIDLDRLGIEGAINAASAGEPCPIGQWSPSFHADSVRRTSLRRARSTVSLTSARLAAPGTILLSITHDSGTGKSYTPSETSLSRHLNLGHPHEKKRSGKHRADSSDPPGHDMAVVVVSLTTQSSGPGSHHHQEDFLESSQSDLIATCDFI